MGQKSLQVHLRVTAQQFECMHKKAEAYGIPLSRLVLLAVEAYARAYDEGLGDSQLVVINYGVWAGVDRHLGRIESVLRESAQQLVGARMALASGVRSGVLPRGEARKAYEALRGCHDDVALMREAVERCTSLMDRVCDAAHLVDPYLGPMECGQDAGDEGAADAAGAVPEGR